MDDITSIKKAKHDSEEFKKLEEKHIKMIMKIINSFNLDWGDYSINKEDLKQEALIGLYEACENFDPKYNVKFSTFAYQIMRRRVNRAYQKMRNITIFLSQTNRYRRPYSVIFIYHPGKVTDISDEC